MKSLHLLLPTFACLLVFFFCKKQESAILAPSSPPAADAPIDSFALTTPDSIAFALIEHVEKGETEYHIHYHGLVNALRDSAEWKSYPYLIVQPDSSACMSMMIFNQHGQLASEIGICHFSVKPGTYTSRQADISFYYSDMNDGCAQYNWYRPDPNQLSFLKVISYNHETREMRARFKLHFIKKKDNGGPHSPYPDSIFFDDGAVIAIRIK